MLYKTGIISLYSQMDFDFLKLILQAPEKQDMVPMLELAFRIGVATLLGFLISGVSYLTYTGKNYDRSVIHSQIIVTIVFSVMINVIGQNLAWAVGIFGSLSFIQFRTTLRDAKDTATFFYSVVTGVACGAGYINLAIFGFFVMSLVQVILKYLPPLEVHYTYIKFNCKNIEAKEMIKSFLKRERVKYELAAISVKAENVIFAVRLPMESSYELAKKAKLKLPEWVDSFSLDREL
ncbi:MAG TPA: hypothetical protein PKC66_17850 [Leptospiraceae bacterium]|nr:hypothetical protein [Leptospiraceae bacterium]HMX34104.1 hypothetical protein [Leptospiraceae bacterium]HMZ63032.1 hypothetical protein [Leptospiraceae bacterium]HNB97608.1 hypothetical protein [Leptospiraceae bacterium]HNG99622.1 hypothetical protein [Leptospiraceae bacterium]